MFSRIWKGIFTEPAKCGAELKYGIQIHRDVQCVLPKGHPGAHRASQFIVWPNMPARKEGK